jgi:hypothetical protein
MAAPEDAHYAGSVADWTAEEIPFQASLRYWQSEDLMAHRRVRVVPGSVIAPMPHARPPF